MKKQHRQLIERQLQEAIDKGDKVKQILLQTILNRADRLQPEAWDELNEVILEVIINFARSNKWHIDDEDEAWGCLLGPLFSFLTKPSEIKRGIL